MNSVYGYDFKGWYNGNQLISSNLTYTFKLSSDCSFVAIFEETEMPALVAGKLSEMILPGNIGSVTDLKLNGEMNWLDFMYIKNNLTALQELDISNVKIVGYYDEQTGVTYYEDQIPDNALNNYTVLENLHTIILPENITIIGRQSFDGLRNLSSINLPNSVREILYYAFGYNNITDEIRLPDNLQRIQSYIFAGNKTKGFTISDKNDNFTTENGFLYDKSKMILYISPGQAESRIYRAPKELIYLQPWGFSDMDYDLFDASECSKFKNLLLYFFLSSKIKKVILPDIHFVV